jgi:hypothetical protein
MSRWETTSTLEADVSPAAVWERAYANAGSWPQWNAEIKRANLDGPLALGVTAKIIFGTGLRLRFRVVEFEDGRLFTDESRPPGARMDTVTWSSQPRRAAAASPTPSTSRDRWRPSGAGSWDQSQRGPFPAPSEPWSS